MSDRLQKRHDERLLTEGKIAGHLHGASKLMQLADEMVVEVGLANRMTLPIASAEIKKIESQIAELLARL